MRVYSSYGPKQKGHVLISGFNRDVEFFLEEYAPQLDFTG